MVSLRIFFFGGLTSYRAMFGWLRPSIAIPVFVFEPITQILLFAFIGRSAGAADDRFYVIGNAIQFAAIPCLFAMGNTIEGEREAHTLSVVLASPARRLPLFLGRALPVVVNGWGVTLVGLLAGVVFLHIHIPGDAWLPMLLVVLVSSASCTGLGLAMGAIALRVREGAVIANVAFCALLIFSGVNVALADLPAWMAGIGHWLPLSHAIEAARRLADGDTLGSVGGLLLRELGVGAIYLVFGLLLLRWLETASRRYATLDRV
jgi:ABC-2 type transport system permease protein